MCMKMYIRQEEVAVAVVVEEVVEAVGYPRHCFHFLNRHLLDLDCNLLGKDLDKHLELYTKFRYRRFHKHLRS